MEMRNRQEHIPIPVTMEDLERQKWCPCCKNGIISREEAAPMAVCSVCGQRYQIKDKEEKDGEAKTEAKQE